MKYKRSQIKVFSKDWFEINQPILLFILNNPFAYKIRELIGINRIEPIYKLTPNAVHFKLDKEYYKAEFYTRAVFADMLHKNFESVWRTLHNIDMFFKLIKLGRINFGFDTLTVYPDPDPEVNTVDGNTGTDSTDMTWANKRNQEGSVSNDNTTQSYYAYIRTSTTSGYYRQIYRSHFLFDTSSLTANVNIISADFSFVPYFIYLNTPFDVDLHLCSTNPASNTAIVPADHQTVGDISFGSIASNSVILNIRNYITLNSNGLAAISKTGISKFGARLGTDIYDIEPTEADNISAYYLCYYAELGGSQKPRLDVTYQPSTSIKSLLGVDYSDVKSVLGVDRNNIKSILGIE